MDNFEIICKLGAGGFSKVYKVRRKIDDKIYALKKVQILNLSEKQKLSSLNEIRVLASIKNKYVVNYKEAFLDEKDCTLCLVMEYADRGDLANRIKQQKEKGKYFNEKDIWKVFIQLVKGLKSLHDMGILHRDIKCSNIFLFSNGIAKIGDLNVCKILSNESLGHTQAGTPAYAAPEVWMEKPYGLKSDIWSLGCVLYEMITLHVPFRAESMVKLYNKVLVGEFCRIPNKFSEDLYWIIEQMINSDINKRLTCDEILECECVKKRMEQNNNINKKCFSEKTINGYKIKNNKLFKEKNSNDNYNYNNNYEERKEEENELLRTIYMPYNLLFLKDELPKPNYSQELKKNNLSKINKSININSELAPSVTSISHKLSSDTNIKNYLSKLKKFPQEPIFSYQKNSEINTIFNRNKYRENSQRIKVKHINSTRDINDYIFSENNDNIANNNYFNIINKKNSSNLNITKIKDYLYLHEKEKDKEIKNENLIEKHLNEKDREINNNNLYINNDKLKLLFNTKKFKKNFKLNEDFDFKIKLKKEDNNNINNRYNNIYNIENNYNDIINDYNEISADINKILNKTNGLKNKNNNNSKNIHCINSVDTNNNFSNNKINNYKYNKNENKFNNSYKKKKSFESLPKIKYSYFKRDNNNNDEQIC